MNRLLLLLFLSGFSTQTLAEKDLPGQHRIKVNEQGEHYVVNKEDITMIEPAIIKMGFNRRWILACIKHKSIDSDLKRWVFIDLQNGGTFDSLNQENWTYFRDEAYPGLKRIKLKDYLDEACP